MTSSDEQRLTTHEPKDPVPVTQPPARNFMGGLQWLRSEQRPLKWYEILAQILAELIEKTTPVLILLQIIVVIGLAAILGYSWPSVEARFDRVGMFVSEWRLLFSPLLVLLGTLFYLVRCRYRLISGEIGS